MMVIGGDLTGAEKRLFDMPASLRRRTAGKEPGNRTLEALPLDVRFLLHPPARFGPAVLWPSFTV